jgi:(1->4)-alpha-D-glucan 1-alpha-D-glucosylmutase
VTEKSVFEFVAETLLPFESSPAEEERRVRLELSMRFQQFTGPVQAKGVEDTAFYRQNVLLSLNEVGGDPAHFGRRVEEFHRANLVRLADWPHAMVTTATHDTKRGEDARARLDVLSEMPEEWRQTLALWARVNGVLRAKVHGDWAPDRNDEYLLYQTLLGAWPPASSKPPEPSLVERLGGYFQKAMREAKLHTSWVNPNLAYEQASREFLEQILTGPRAERFLAAFFPFAERVARLGMVNSLAQLVLKLAGPGVVDSYQGTELWDLSLVDPDNRRPVDFAHRERLLGDLAAIDAPAPSRGTAAELLRQWPDGRVKLFVLARGLRARRADSELFRNGGYRPLEAEGERAAHVVAFARAHAERIAVAVVPRLVRPLVREDHPVPLGAESWGETRLRLPADLAGRPLSNLFTGERFDADSSGLRLAEVLSCFPVALLHHSPGG